MWKNLYIAIGWSAAIFALISYFINAVGNNVRRVQSPLGEVYSSTLILRCVIAWIIIWFSIAKVLQLSNESDSYSDDSSF